MLRLRALAERERQHRLQRLPPRRRTRTEPNPLREWLEATPRPMTKRRFAQLIGVSAAYVSWLICDDAPWPGREIARRIGIATEGAVDPNMLAGYPPDD